MHCNFSVDEEMMTTKFDEVGQLPPENLSIHLRWLDCRERVKCGS